MRSLVVGDKSGSRDVGYLIPQGGLQGERPVVSGGRGKTQREELRCKAESDAAEGPVVKIRRVLFHVVDRGKSEAWLSSSRAHGHMERLLEFTWICACMEGATEDRSRVTDEQILEGSMAGRTEQEVRGNPVSMDRW